MGRWSIFGTLRRSQVTIALVALASTTRALGLPRRPFRSDCGGVDEGKDAAATAAREAEESADRYRVCNFT
jgi:hypothetical protein